MTADDWSHEETDDPLYVDRRNFYKVEKWSSQDLTLKLSCALRAIVVA
jgi:hypothetical protein